MSVTLPGTGQAVASELVSGAQYQQVKLVKGDAGSATPITKTDPLPVAAAPASNASVVGIDQNASVVTLLAANTARRGAMVYNNGDKDLCVKFGSGATTALFSVKLVVGAYFEVPASYSGTITGIWSGAGSGKALITEIS